MEQLQTFANNLQVANQFHYECWKRPQDALLAALKLDKY